MGTLLEVPENAAVGSIVYELSPESLNQENMLPDVIYNRLPESIREDMALELKVPDTVVTEANIGDIEATVAIPMSETIADAIPGIASNPRANTAARSALAAIDTLKVAYSGNGGVAVAVDRELPIGPNGTASAVVEVKYELGGEEALQDVLMNGTDSVQPEGLIDRLEENAQSATIKVTGLSERLNETEVSLEAQIPGPLINDVGQLVRSVDSGTDLQAVMGSIPAGSWEYEARATGYGNQSMVFGVKTNVDPLYDRATNRITDAVGRAGAALSGVPVVGPALSTAGQAVRVGNRGFNRITTAYLEGTAGVSVYDITNGAQVRPGVTFNEGSAAVVYRDGSGILSPNPLGGDALEVFTEMMGVPETDLADGVGRPDGPGEIPYPNRIAPASDIQFTDFLLDRDSNYGSPTVEGALIRLRLAEDETTPWQESARAFHPSSGFRNFGVSSVALANMVNELALAYPQTSGNTTEIVGRIPAPGNPFPGAGQTPGSVQGQTYRADFINNTDEARAFLQDLRQELGPTSPEWQAVVDKLAAAQTYGNHSLYTNFALPELAERLENLPPNSALGVQRERFDEEDQNTVEPVFGDSGERDAAVDYVPSVVRDPAHPTAAEQWNEMVEESPYEEFMPRADAELDPGIADADTTPGVDVPSAAGDGMFADNPIAEELIEELDQQLENQAVQDQDVQDQDVQDQAVQDQDVQDQDVQDQEVQDQDVQDQEVQDQDVQDQEVQDQDVQDQEVQDQDVQDQETLDQEVQDQDVQDQEVQDQEVQDQEVQDQETLDPETLDQDVEDGEPQESDTEAPETEESETEDREIEDRETLDDEAWLADEPSDVENPDAENPDTGNPDTGNPDTGNPDVAHSDVEEARLSPDDAALLAAANADVMGYLERIDAVITGTVQNYFDASDVDVQQLMEQFEQGSAAAFIAEQLSDAAPDGVGERLETVLAMRDEVDDDLTEAYQVLNDTGPSVDLAPDAGMDVQHDASALAPEPEPDTEPSVGDGAAEPVAVADAGMDVDM